MIEKHLENEDIYVKTDPITPTELKNKINKFLDKLSVEGKLCNQMVSNMKIRDA